ncbi:MAG: hypothetical protein CMK59_08630 [Proteobacteria bacterium]|nr:hypothetical protein [Pseudomonadota bacterium]
MFDENIFNQIMKEANAGKKKSVPNNQEEQKILNDLNRSHRDVRPLTENKKNREKPNAKAEGSEEERSNTSKKQGEPNIRKQVEDIFSSDQTSQQGRFRARATARKAPESKPTITTSKSEGGARVQRAPAAQRNDVMGWLDAEEKQKKALQEAKKQIEQLSSEKLLLQEDLKIAQKHLSQMEEELHQAREALSVQNKETTDLLAQIKMLTEQQDKSEQQDHKQENVSLISLLEERGLTSRREHLQFLSRFANDPRAVHFISSLHTKKAQELKQFLQENVRLEHSELSSLSQDVVRIDVNAERCEITGGGDLEVAVRELLTTFLCNGFNRVYVFGGPSRLTSPLEALVRHQSFMLTCGDHVQDVNLERFHMVVLWKHCDANSDDPVFDLSEDKQREILNLRQQQMLCTSNASSLVALMNDIQKHIEQ